MGKVSISTAHDKSKLLSYANFPQDVRNTTLQIHFLGVII